MESFFKILILNALVVIHWYLGQQWILINSWKILEKAIAFFNDLILKKISGSCLHLNNVHKLPFIHLSVWKSVRGSRYNENFKIVIMPIKLPYEKCWLWFLFRKLTVSIELQLLNRILPKYQSSSLTLCLQWCLIKLHDEFFCILRRTFLRVILMSKYCYRKWCPRASFN